MSAQRFMYSRNVRRPGGVESFANERVDGGFRGRLQEVSLALRLHARQQSSGGLGFLFVRLLRLGFGLESCV
jgi:hypothetical protein